MCENMQFEELGTEEFQEKVYSILKEVINLPGSMLEIFPPRSPFRILDVHWAEIPESILEILKRVSLFENSLGLYYVILSLEGSGMNIKIPTNFAKSWYIPIECIDELRNIFSPLCYALFSPKGSWGLFATHEEFLMLGANKEIGDSILNFAPDIVDESLERFFMMYKMKYEKLNYRWEWLPKLIQHLYGQYADEVLERYELFSSSEDYKNK